MRLTIALLAAVAMAMLSAAACATDLVVIVSNRIPAAAMRPDQVAAIFLGQCASFPDGRDAVALDQPVGSNLRDQFYDRVAGKSPALLRAYWSKMVFTGRGQPPHEARDSVAVRKAVADNPSLIGYIDASALDASVRPVLWLR
jgi:ABC-type phosphate transport system substrate-binding protein